MSRNLTPRQAEILALVAAGLADKEIAVRLNVSVPTVRTHLRRLFRDRGYHNRAEAAVDWMALQSASLAAGAGGPTGGTPAPGLVARHRAALAATLAATLAGFLLAGFLLHASAVPGIIGARVAHQQAPTSPAATRPATTPPFPANSPEASPTAAAPGNQNPAPTPAPALVPAASPPVAISTQAATGQLALVNHDRASAGLPPLQWNGCLASVAAGIARLLARQGYVGPTNGPALDLGCGLGSLTSAENAGYWGSVNDAQLNTMFMANPLERARILGGFRYLGAAWALAPGGAAYLVEELD